MRSRQITQDSRHCPGCDQRLQGTGLRTCSSGGHDLESSYSCTRRTLETPIDPSYFEEQHIKQESTLSGLFCLGGVGHCHSFDRCAPSAPRGRRHRDR